MEFSDFLAANGFDATTLTDKQKTALQASWRATLKGGAPSEGGDPFDSPEYSEARNPDRYAAMVAEREACDAEGITGNERALRTLRTSRFPGPNTRIPSGQRPGMAHVIEASMAMQFGAPAKALAADYGDRVVDAATGKDFRGLGLHALCRMALQSRGLSTGPGRLTESALWDAMASHGSGLSTLSVAGILGNAMNKSMLAAFTSTPTTWSKFCRQSSVNDFKSATAYRLTDAGEIENIPPGGEIQHGTLGESSYTRQAAQYGKLIGLDRVQIVNDDLGAFAQIPAVLSRMSAMTLERKVYETLLANAGDFFGTSNGNNLTGGGSVLGDTGLTTAWQTMMELEDSDGRPVLVTPSVLLVCPKLWRTARSLTQSTGTNATTTANVPVGDGNPWNGLLDVVASPYLGLSQAISGGSDTLWYLTTGPGEFSIIDVHFLDGKSVPTVESFEMPANRLGMTWRVVFDFGVALHEPKGGVRNAGA